MYIYIDVTGSNVTVRDIKTKKKTGIPDISIILSNGKFLSIAFDNDDELKDWGSHIHRAVVPFIFPALVCYIPGPVCTELFKPLVLSLSLERTNEYLSLDRTKDLSLSFPTYMHTYIHTYIAYIQSSPCYYA